MKAKENKGITLIALIITIIILLILAVVTIMAVNGDGIIGKAKQAKEEYQNAQAEEQNVLDKYLAEMEGLASNNALPEIENPGETTITWTDNGDGTLTSSNGITVAIGDYVNYNEGSFEHTPDTTKGAGTSQTGGNSSSGYTLGTSTLTTEDLSWRVLGINAQGQLELISADPTSQTLYLANDEGYVNAEENLNNFCNDLYGKGEYATGARSLNVEDINKLTKYDPTTYSGYGQKWIYRYPTEEEMGSSTRYMQYSTNEGSTWNNITNSDYQTFRLPEETTPISSSNPGRKELTYSYYYYDITNNLTTEDGYSQEKVTQIAKMIINGTGSSNINQWLASRCVACDSDYPSFAVRNVYRGSVRSNSLFYSREYFNYYIFRVRAVVSLTSDITLTGTGDNVGSEDNMWNITQN